MRIGFTGTRRGMTQPQRDAFVSLLHAHKPAEFHHGGAVGADEEAVVLVDGLCSWPVEIVCHPGVSARGGVNPDRSRTAVALSDRVLAEANHFARNRAIVLACDLLLGAVPEAHKLTTGGTWYTLGYAKTVGKRRLVLWPDGTVTDGDESTGVKG